MPCVPYAGDAGRLYMLPEPGTGVWVEFEAGDPSYPIWSGCFWADERAAGRRHRRHAEGHADREGRRCVLDDDTHEIHARRRRRRRADDRRRRCRAKRDRRTHTVATDGVTSEISSGQSVEVDAVQRLGQHGALEVM